MDLSKHLDNAKDAISRRNYKLAAQICSQLLSIQPDAGEARTLLRQALYKKAETKPTPKVAAWLGGGVHLLTLTLTRAMGQHAAAARAAERYLALDPLSESVNLRLGDSLSRAGHDRSALAVYRAYADHQPRCAEACRNAGALLYEAGELDAALEMYERALRVDPRDQEALKARKNLAAEGALRSSGIEHAENSRELLKNAGAQAQLERDSRLQLDKDEIQDELAKLEEALSGGDVDLKTLTRVAELRRMDGDFEGALDCLERALELDATRSDLADQAGDLRLRIQEKRVEEARARGDEAALARVEGVFAEMRVAEFRRRIEARPTDFGLRCQLGEALLATGDVDGAIAELQQGVKDPRRKNDARLALATAFRKKGLPELAAKQLAAALDDIGDFGQKARGIMYEMGCVAEEAGQHEEALAHFSRVLEQDIGYKDVAQKVEQLKGSKSS